MAVSLLNGPALVRVDYAKTHSLVRRVGRLPGRSCGRNVRVPSAIHADPTPSSSNGKVPETHDRDQEDLLAPVGLFTSNLLRASRPSSEADAKAVAEIAREKFWGRVAVLALGAALLAERLTGDGVVKSMELATGIPLWEIDPFLGLLVLGLLVAAFFPSKSEQSQLMQNAKAAHEKARSFGKNVVDRIQNLIGRLACFGLAGSIVAEVTTGQGTLALLNIQTGVESISEVEAGIAFLLMLVLTEDVKLKRR